MHFSQTGPGHGSWFQGRDADGFVWFCLHKLRAIDAFDTFSRFFFEGNTCKMEHPGSKWYLKAANQQKQIYIYLLSSQSFTDWMQYNSPTRRSFTMKCVSNSTLQITGYRWWHRRPSYERFVICSYSMSHILGTASYLFWDNVDWMCVVVFFFMALGEQDAEEKAEKIANPSGYIKARMTAQAIMLRLIPRFDVGAVRFFV